MNTHPYNSTRQVGLPVVWDIFVAPKSRMYPSTTFVEMPGWLKTNPPNTPTMFTLGVAISRFGRASSTSASCGVAKGEGVGNLCFR